MVVFCALFLGGWFAFGDYYRQSMDGNSTRRELSRYRVERDTQSALIWRFVLGAGGGAAVGIYYAIRGDKKEE